MKFNDWNQYFRKLESNSNFQIFLSDLVKVYIQNEVVMFDLDMQFQTFKEKCCKKLGIELLKDFYYFDPEGDKISIKDDEDFEICKEMNVNRIFYDSE